MDKSSSIKNKSNRLMVNINRAFVKLSLALTVLSIAICLFSGFDIKNNLLIFSSVSAVVFALSYIICYYLYKFCNKNKSEKVKKDPLFAQIILMLRFISFVVGFCLVVYGANLIHSGNDIGFLLFPCIVLCQLLLNSNKIMSHLSTFCENLSAGIFAAYVYIAMSYGLSLNILQFFILTFIFNILQEFFYYFFDVKKHKNEPTPFEELFKIRLKYLLRNTLIYVILYALSFLLIYCNILQSLLSSDITNFLLQTLPIVISIISIIIAYVQAFSTKKISDNYDFNTIINGKDYLAAMTKDNSDANFQKALVYVTNEMTAKKGYARDDGEDYYLHPVNVATILQNAGYTNSNLLCTALLHDCIEDLPNCTKQTIENLTNKEVANNVDILSKKPNIDYHISENFSSYMDNILSNEHACLVKIADRLHNMSTIKNTSKEKQMRKIKETKEHFIPFIDKAKTLYPSHIPFFEKAKIFFTELE